MRKKFSKKARSIAATILGIITALATAYAVIDFNTFDIKKDWFRLVVIGLPVIGGFVSRIKETGNSETNKEDDKK